jgi:nucleotide-binding universal stress UspA family protein
VNSSHPAVLVVAIDYSAASAAALKHAIGLSQLFGAELHLVHVSSVALPKVDPSQPVEHNLYHQMQIEAETTLQEFTANVPKALHTVRKVLFGQPEVLLPSYVASLKDAWLILGSRHKGGLERALLGSVAEYLLRHATYPVLVVPTAD